MLWVKVASALEGLFFNSNNFSLNRVIPEKTGEERFINPTKQQVKIVFDKSMCMLCQLCLVMYVLRK